MELSDISPTLLSQILQHIKDKQTRLSSSAFLSSLDAWWQLTKDFWLFWYVLGDFNLLYIYICRLFNAGAIMTQRT